MEKTLKLITNKKGEKIIDYKGGVYLVVEKGYKVDLPFFCPKCSNSFLSKDDEVEFKKSGHCFMCEINIKKNKDALK